MALTSLTYQKESILKAKLIHYVDQVANFKGATWCGKCVEYGKDFTKRAVDLIVPKGAGTDTQQRILEEVKRYAAKKGVELNIINH